MIYQNIRLKFCDLNRQLGDLEIYIMIVKYRMEFGLYLNKQFKYVKYFYYYIFKILIKNVLFFKQIKIFRLNLIIFSNFVKFYDYYEGKNDIFVSINQLC